MTSEYPQERSTIDRSEFVSVMHELHDEIQSALSKPEMNPAQVMRVTALGVDYCLVALATLLEDGGKQE